jgi:nitrite reductase/ring-hydroxylating ferredoxin subunit
MTWHDVGGVNDFTEGAMRNITLENRTILIVKLEDGIHAMDGRCSHMNADLSRGRLEGHGVECPMHRAVFDLRNGEVIRNLAARKLRSYPLRIEGEQVQIDI